MGITNLAAFNDGLDRFAKKVERRGLLFQKKVAFMVLGAYLTTGDGSIRAISGLLQLTPVDTGRAVGNYQVSIGSPATGTLDDGFRQSYQGKSAGRQSLSIGGRNRDISKVTTRAARALSGLQFGQTIWIVNNLPYIMVLNNGGPKRTAHHMLERALANVRASLRSA